MKNKGCFKLFGTLFILLIFVLGIGALVAYLYYQDSVNSYRSTKDATFVVADGESLAILVDKLQSQGLIRDSLTFRIYIKTNNLESNIKPGSYQIPAGSSISDTINILEKGELKKQVSVTIKEGLRFEEIAKELESAFLKETGTKFDKSEFMDIANSSSSYPFSQETIDFINLIKPTDRNLEGILFADTYTFNYDTTTTEVAETMITNFKYRLDENNIDYKTTSVRSLNSFYKVLSLASIIQEEARGEDSKRTVAGIFYNRLDQDYPLQSDATLNYVTRRGTESALLVDTEIDSPYNTYKNLGVTYTPICSPSILAIQAALEPKETDYFYFIYDTKGNVYYAVTYEQHLQNIANYL